MPSDEGADDDAVRQSYNFAPGYFGLVYRADTSDYGAGPKPSKHDTAADDSETANRDAESRPDADGQETHYKLQAMKWGLVPSWTKRNPDYGTIMRTINCRDDSLAENRGMWINMKKRKRCIVICHGFYEWLKKNNGKERIPHYIKRKDGQLMCFAGLWDCVQYEGEDAKNYTFTIITTDANKQIQFLHDRMPVILNLGSEEIRTWLDPARYDWSKELQRVLKPWDGELEIYPVNKDVGKVGNDSPNFIIPINSTENKSNIANFFNSQAKTPKKNTKKADDDQTPSKDENTETHAPAAVASPASPSNRAVKREHKEVTEDAESYEQPKKVLKSTRGAVATAPPSSPIKVGRKGHSATSNGTVPRNSPRKPAPPGSQKITSFFGKKGG